MQSFYHSLNEKEKRFYAATEAKKIGHGGQVYISKILKCCRQTISTGLKELDKDLFVENRIRKEGAGRKPYYKTHSNIDDIFEECILNGTAGSPMKENIKWTNLSNEDIVNCMKSKGANISTFVVRKLLKKHDYVKRSNQKKTP